MPEILVDRRADGVALITFNRPESLNAIGGDFFSLFEQALDECAHDDAVRCVALTGAGRAFCAGADVKGMANSAGGFGKARTEPGYDDQVARVRALQNHSTALIYNMPKPTVALINGVAAGGGFAFVLACDVRLAAESARFSTSYARIGVSSDFGTAFLLERLAPAYAPELLYTAEVFDVQRAATMGIVNRILPDDRLMEDGLEFCQRLAAGPTFAITRMKKNLQHARTATLQESMDFEAAHIVETFASEDHRTGALAFVHKEPPRFAGR